MDDVNKVQLDIRIGHAKTVESVMEMLTDEGSLKAVIVCWKMETLFCDLKEMVRFGAFELRECEMVTVVVRRRHRGDVAEWCGCG
ncbi:putative magnesium protoporphyrin IX methyltransferase [Helianthus anomalus]